MSKHRFVVRPIVSALRLSAVAAFTLCLVQCSAEQPGDTASEPELGSVSQALEQCGGRSCQGNIDCKVNVPVCGVMSTAFCLIDPPKQCVWKIDTTNANCRCIEHDVRLCTLPGGGAGVQICTKINATAADWATCTTTPACTP